VPIHFTTFALGGDVEIKDIEGQKVTLKIPAGAQYGQQIVIKGKGMVSGQGRGALIAHILIQVPKNLTTKQRQLLQELDTEFTSTKSSESILDKMKNLWK
jgi:molecular chaperone DnaJ